MSDYSATFPPQRPVFNADFSNSSKIDPRATFSRPDSPINPSNAPASAVHYWSNEKHLSSENLLLQSEDFTTTWSMSEANGAAGATAPDGGTDAYTITCYTASSKAPRLNQSLSGKLSANTQYTMVGHVKAGTATHGYISFRGNNSNNYAYAQIEFASPGSVSTGGVGFTSISGTVTALGSSWYRLTLTATTGSDVSGAFAFLGPNDGTAFGISGYPIWDTAAETLVIWGAQISTTQAKFYDSPTTTQISRSYAPTLKSPATAGAARFEHDPATNVSQGILIESQSTNELSYSENFDESYWSKSTGGTSPAINLTISLNAAISPSGDLTADLVVPKNTGGNTLYYIAKTYSFTSGDTYTLSVYAKAAGMTEFTLAAGNTATWAASTRFTLTGDGSASVSSGSAQIQKCGNGWYRLSITGTAGASTSTNLLLQCVSGGQNSFDGDDYSGVLLWGAQFEEGTLSSYVQTLLSAKTRAADSLSMPIADTGYTGGPVTLLAESTTQTDTTNPVTLALYANGDQQIFLYGNSTNKRAAYVEADNTASTLTSTADANGVRALRVDTNDIATALNGTIDATDTSQTLPDLTGATVYIGDDSNGGNSIDGHIKRVAIYNEALSDTNLQAITS